MKNPSFTTEFLRLLVSYDAETGALTWKEREESSFRSGEHSAARRCAIWNAKHAGRSAGHVDLTHGYARLAIAGRVYKAHRVAWQLHYGEVPDGHIDHINGDRTDNRIVNLRLVDNQANAQNRKRQRNNTSGAVGVSRTKWGTFRSYIKVDQKLRLLGTHATIEAAIEARLQAERQAGFHANHGRG
jgi:hypothetical protein